MPLIEDLGAVKSNSSTRFYSYTTVGPQNSINATSSFSQTSNSSPSLSNQSLSSKTGSNQGPARSKRNVATTNFGIRSRQTDGATKQRAIKRRIAELERENYNEQHLRFEVPKVDYFTAPSQQGTPTAPGTTQGHSKRRSSKMNVLKSGATPATRKILASRKTLANLIDDDPAGAQALSELCTGPSKYPLKHLCNICGFKGKYSCMRCGLRYCSLKCDYTHKETRCLRSYG